MSSHIRHLPLLLMLILGVSGMHTLGHHTPTHTLYGEAASSSAHAAPAMAMSAQDGWTPDLTGPGGRLEEVDASVQALEPGSGLLGLDPVAVCLAVLVSLVLLALAATRSRTPREREWGSGLTLDVSTRARPPPLSLRLTAVAVLRI